MALFLALALSWCGSSMVRPCMASFSSLQPLWNIPTVLLIPQMWEKPDWLKTVSKSTAFSLQPLWEIIYRTGIFAFLNVLFNFVIFEGSS